jgi:hypothetical protein
MARRALQQAAAGAIMSRSARRRAILLAAAPAPRAGRAADSEHLQHD